MRAVFVDAAYWIALANRKDRLHAAAVSLAGGLRGAKRYTTQEVLGEVLTSFSRLGEGMRQRAIKLVRALESDPNVIVIPQSSRSFSEGLRLYAKRPDKGYSLQDCISMNAMWTHGISEVLTSDHHFEQEGFTILLK